jgi:hypothetical protein
VNCLFMGHSLLSGVFSEPSPDLVPEVLRILRAEHDRGRRQRLPRVAEPCDTPPALPERELGGHVIESRFSLRAGMIVH